MRMKILAFELLFLNSCFVYRRKKEKVEREEEMKAKEGVFRGIPPPFFLNNLTLQLYLGSRHFLKNNK